VATQLVVTVAKTLDGIVPPIRSALAADLGPNRLLAGLHLHLP
jgi:hypothetical protein